ERLRQRCEALAVDDDPIIGTPRFVRSRSGFLTGATPQLPPLSVVQGFVRDFADFFELDAAEVPAARVTRWFTDDVSGITHITLQQQSNGIDLFGAEIRANVMRDGRLLSVGSTMVPRPSGGFQFPPEKLCELEAIRAGAR